MKLEKSFQAKHIAKFTKNITPESVNAVNADYQSTLAAPIHPEAKLALEDPKPISHPKSYKEIGYAPKAIGDLSSGRYMYKPYHQKPQAQSRYAPNPIYGWATIANHALFHAAGLGNHVEDVSMVKHKGQWYNVHKFKPDVQSQWDLRFDPSERLPNPHTISKINVMDFLTGNADRHEANIMYGENDDTNELDPLAIDHDRSFQYRTKGDGAKLFPQNLSSYHTPSWRPQSEMRKTSDATAKWFLENEKNLHDTFDKHVQAINDERIKDHVNANFKERMKYLHDSFSGYQNLLNSGQMDKGAIDRRNPFHPEYQSIIALPIRRKAKKDALPNT